MWKYNNLEELYHVGILGMRWGKRNPTRSQINRSTFKNAKKDIKKAWLKTAKKNGGLGGTDKQNKDYEEGADKYINDMKKVKSYYKSEKRNIRGEINKEARAQNDRSSFGERLLYNNATRRKAGKLVVERGMTRDMALSKAKKEAWRNTAIMSIAAISGMYLSNKIK